MCSVEGWNEMQDWCDALSLFCRLFAYIGLLALIVLVIFMLLKYIAKFGEATILEDSGVSETDPLQRPRKALMPFTYGTYCSKDLESGNCSSSSSKGSSSEELYDVKLCVICYDEERNCFFVPCGHCATCYVCAKRILEGENKVCPVCRRFLGKVRKLFAL